MALQKDMLVGGNIFNYHKIKTIKIDAINMDITVEMGHYKDRAFRESNPNDNITRTVRNYKDPAMFQTVANMKTFEVFGLMYAEWKKSKLIQEIIDGVPQFGEDESTPIMIESNWYADAVDVIETV